MRLPDFPKPPAAERLACLLAQSVLDELEHDEHLRNMTTRVDEEQWREQCLGQIDARALG
jgi:hypothetical protein